MSSTRSELAVEELQPLITLSPTGTRARAASALEWLRGRVTTTPGRLASISVLVVAGAVCFGVIATAAESSRAHAAQAARSQTEPLLVHAVNLYTALSDANATATENFKTGGIERQALRNHYLDRLRLASDSLATLTRQVGNSPSARAAVVTITEQLPLYSGEIEAARANNRQGFPVGAAYLRRASRRLNRLILPQANQLYATEARHLSDDYATGTGTGALVVITVAIAAALGLLAITQLYLARLSRRILNIPTVVATAVLLGASIWAIVGLLGEQSALGKAQRNGSDSVEVLSAAQVLVSRAQSDESLALLGRGSDQLDAKDLTRMTQALAPPSGLIGEAEVVLRRTGTAAIGQRLANEFASFAASPGTPSRANQLKTDLAGRTTSAQSRFERAATDATSSVTGLSIAIPVLTVLVAALALVGLRQRLNEYR